MSGVSYQVVDGYVEVTRSGDVVWRGHVAGCDAVEAMELPGTDDGIVTLNWMHPPDGVELWHPFQNLVRIRPDGTVVWTAQLTAGEKFYTGASWDGGRLLGYLVSHWA